MAAPAMIAPTAMVMRRRDLLLMVLTPLLLSPRAAGRTAAGSQHPLLRTYD